MNKKNLLSRTMEKHNVVNHTINNFNTHKNSYMDMESHAKY